MGGGELVQVDVDVHVGPAYRSAVGVNVLVVVEEDLGDQGESVGALLRWCAWVGRGTRFNGRAVFEGLVVARRFWFPESLRRGKSGTNDGGVGGVEGALDGGVTVKDLTHA